jgi:catechol 2,3-dioxygenase-like lactoylglutathione lyase family enzyme
MTTGQEAGIDRITLIVSDLDRAEDDYVRTFGCSVEQRGDIDPALIGVLCIRQARGRRSLLRLGRERIELLEFTDMAGRPYPPDSTSTDLWFQHVAIIVDDMKSPHQRVMANRRFRPISRNGPVRLPDTSGGVTAFKFRDHDGHPLELLAFPEGRVPGEWRNADGTGPFLGVDHTAIAVSDSASSTRFFSSVFGFSAGPRTENRGPEQADLDDVDDVQVSVTRLAPDLPAPGLELLHYHVGTRRPIPRDTASNDIVATHSAVRVASLDVTAAALARRGTPLADHDLMILRGGTRAALVTGPDGHRFLVEERQWLRRVPRPARSGRASETLGFGYGQGRLRVHSRTGGGGEDVPDGSGVISSRWAIRAAAVSATTARTLTSKARRP